MIFLPQAWLQIALEVITSIALGVVTLFLYLYLSFEVEAVSIQDGKQ